MNKGKLFADFKSHLKNSDNDTILKFIDSHPQIAQFVGKEDGLLVTALDAAMDLGKANVCEKLLNHGARIDIPVGAPPTSGFAGYTSMSKVISVGFEKSVPNHAEILDVMARHLAEQDNKKSQQSRLDNLSDGISSVMKRIGGGIKKIIESESFQLGAISAIPAGVGAAIGVMTVAPSASPIVVPFVALTSLAGIVGFAASKAMNSHNDSTAKMRDRHDRASEIVNGYANAYRKKSPQNEMGLETAKRIVNGLKSTLGSVKPAVEQGRKMRHQ